MPSANDILFSALSFTFFSLIFKAVADGLFAHVVLADHAQGHVEPVAREVVDKVEPPRVVFDARPVDFVGNGLAADFLDLFDAAGEGDVLKFFNLAALFRPIGGSLRETDEERIPWARFRHQEPQQHSKDC